jgi:hypothetical protein
VATSTAGEASFSVAFAAPTATVELLVASEPYYTPAGVCYGPDGQILGSTGSWSFAFDVSPAGRYRCELAIQEVRTRSATVELSTAVFGDDDNVDPVPGWEFGVLVSGGTPSASQVTTDEEGLASFRVDLGEGVDAAEVTITGVRRDGHQVEGGCSTGKRVGATYVFNVVDGRSYTCWFWYADNGTIPRPTPKPTPPATDTIEGSPGGTPADALPLALATGAVSVVVGSHARGVTVPTARR